MADPGEPEQQGEYDLLVLGGALLAAAGLFLALCGYMSAPLDCRRFGQSDFFGCGWYAALTVVGDALAALACAALIAVTPIRPPRRLVFLGKAAIAAAVVAALASPLRVVGQADLMSRVIAIAWLVIGVWLFQASRTAPLVMRSTLGVVLGVTLIVAGLLQGLGEERPFPIGGALFSIAFGAWAIRLATRLVRSWRPPPPRPESARTFALDILIGVGVAFIALPAWIGSTFGFAPLGDPAVTITISNGSDQAVVFFMDREYRQYSYRLDAGASREISELAHGVYFPAAANTAGNLIFCRRLTDSELRLKLRYRIVVVEDPASCR